MFCVAAGDFARSCCFEPHDWLNNSSQFQWCIWFWHDGSEVIQGPSNGFLRMVSSGKCPWQSWIKSDWVPAWCEYPYQLGTRKCKYLLGFVLVTSHEWDAWTWRMRHQASCQMLKTLFGCPGSTNKHNRMPGTENQMLTINVSGLHDHTYMLHNHVSSLYGLHEQSKQSSWSSRMHVSDG